MFQFHRTARLWPSDTMIGHQTISHYHEATWSMGVLFGLTNAERIELLANRMMGGLWEDQEGYSKTELLQTVHIVQLIQVRGGSLSSRYFSKSSISLGSAECARPLYVLKSTFHPISFSVFAVSKPHSCFTIGSASPWPIKIGVDLFALSDLT